MNQTDARSFIMALNSAVPYVPPMIMQQITASPMIKVIESVANGQPFNPQAAPEAMKDAG